MSHLRKIVYVSTAVRRLSRSELDRLLMRARERNEGSGVTGLLLYNDGNFMQYIEGPRSDLRAIYQIILGDKMHSNICELVNGPIVQREFADWSMACSRMSAPDFIRLSKATWIEDGQPGHLASGRELLREFWKNTRN